MELLDDKVFVFCKTANLFSTAAATFKFLRAMSEGSSFLHMLAYWRIQFKNDNNVLGLKFTICFFCFYSFLLSFGLIKRILFFKIFSSIRFLVIHLLIILWVVTIEIATFIFDLLHSLRLDLFHFSKNGGLLNCVHVRFQSSVLCLL